MQLLDEYETDLEDVLFDFDGEDDYGGNLSADGEYDELDAEDYEEELGDIVKTAWNWWTKPESKQRAFALNAAKTALTGGGAALGTALTPAGGVAGGAIGAGIAGMLPDKEMAAYLAEAAMLAEDDVDADAFIGAIVPALTAAAPLIKKAAPHLIKGAARVARNLRKSPETRKMVRAIPNILTRTSVDVARRAAAGKPVTGRTATRSLARHTARVLNNPRHCAQAMKRTRHRAARFRRATEG